MNDITPFTQLVQPDVLQDLSPQLRTALFITGMSLLSSMLVTMTAFTRIVIVLSFVRRALSTQEIPPTQVIIGLSLFLTFFVMSPTFVEIEKQALTPYLNDQVGAIGAAQIAAGELKGFMLRQTRDQDLLLFIEMSGETSLATPEETPLRVLIPAFVISELKTAFIMGFCLYLPFILVDLVVSVILMALGMMMMPPVVISTPCKILLFILVDGWSLIAKALSMSFH
ncbi:MAG: flagellar type III secretion system pore protein FliP [Planctomycetaceae bacterium]